MEWPSGTLPVSLSAPVAVRHGDVGRSVGRERNWLVALEHVRELERVDDEQTLQLGTDLAVPVSRDRALAVREALASRAIGQRR